MREFLLDKKNIKYLLIIFLAGLALGFFMRRVGYSFPDAAGITDGKMIKEQAPFLPIFFYVIGLFLIWVIYSSILAKINRITLCRSLAEVAKTFSPLIILSFFCLKNVFLHNQIFLIFPFIFTISTTMAWNLSLIKYPRQSKSKFLKFSSTNLIYLLVIFYAVLFSFLTIQNLNLFQLHCKDFGQNVNLVWNSLNGRPFYNTNEFVYTSALGRHFEPLFYVIFPIYAISNNPRTLLIIQAVVTAAAAIPLFFLTKDITKSRFIAYALAISYLLSPKLHDANYFDFHIESFEPLLIFSTFYFLHKRRLIGFIIFSILLIANREDAPLYILAFGLYAFFIQKKRKLFGATTAAVALAIFFIINLLVMPLFREQSAEAFRGTKVERGYANYYQWLGETSPEKAKTILFHPGFVLKRLFSTERRISYAYLLIPLAFLPLFGRGSLIVAVPAFLEIFLADFNPCALLLGHYNYLILPFVYITAIFGAFYIIYNRENRIFLSRFRFYNSLKTLKQKILGFLYPKAEKDQNQSTHRREIFIGTYLIIAAFLAIHYTGYSLRSTFYLKYPSRDPQSLTVARISGYSPLARGFKWRMFAPTHHAKIGQRIIKKIPRVASVAAQCDIFPHLANRKEIWLYRGYNTIPFKNHQIDYIILDTKNYCRPFLFGDYNANIRQILEEKNYGVVEYNDGWLLLKKGYSTELNDKVIKDFICNFIFEAENLRLHIGRNVEDPDASNRRARFAEPAKSNAGYLAFAATTSYPPGDYQACFRLKIAHNLHEKSAAIIDIVTDQGKTAIVRKEIFAADFGQTKKYQLFILDFSVPSTQLHLEFRLYFQNTVALWFDQISVVPRKKIKNGYH